MDDLIVITDLDGTLLGHESYSFAAAAPALDLIRELQIELVIVTSKTRAEASGIRARLDLPGPDIVENGSWSRDYGWLCSMLEETAAETGVTVRGFHEMTVEEISEATGLSAGVAALAAQRQYSEPFSVLDESRAPELLAALAGKGFQWTRGGRFYHVFERGGKAAAVEELLNRFPGSTSVGLGDAPNDIGFLQLVGYPVIVNSPRAGEMVTALPRATVTRLPAPEGWSEALLPLLRRLRPPAYRP